MTFTAYGCTIKFIKQIDVSSNETIEIEYEDADMCEIKAVYSITYSIPAGTRRIWIGDDIEQDEDEPDNFKVLNGGENIHYESDTEEEEDEEDNEEEETELVVF